MHPLLLAHKWLRSASTRWENLSPIFPMMLWFFWLMSPPPDCTTSKMKSEDARTRWAKTHFCFYINVTIVDFQYQNFASSAAWLISPPPVQMWHHHCCWCDRSCCPSDNNKCKHLSQVQGGNKVSSFHFDCLFSIQTLCNIHAHCDNPVPEAATPTSIHFTP